MLAIIYEIAKGFLASCRMRKGERVKVVQVLFHLAVGVTSLDEHVRVLLLCKMAKERKENTQTCYDPLEQNF